MEGSSGTFTGVMAGLMTSKANARFSGDLYRFTLIVLRSAGTGSNKTRSTRLRSTRISSVLVRSTQVWTDRVRSAWIRLGWSRV